MTQGKKKNRSTQMVIQSEIGTMLREVVGGDRLATEDGQVHPPQADVYETEKEIVIVLDMPGIPKENVDLYVCENRVYVEAVKREKKAPAHARYHCVERYFGKIYRSIEIPSTVHTGKIDARMKNGVLVISMPKIADRRGVKKRIEIK